MGTTARIAGSLTFRPRRGDRPERQATLARGASQTVYVKDADGSPKAVQITTGDTNGSMTEVLSGGLTPGMQVMTGQLGGDSGGAGAGGGQRRQRQGGGGGQ
ncbi:hypothetical protein AB5I41_24210 [Sphingomonas sp. MMS24-JH45]